MPPSNTIPLKAITSFFRKFRLSAHHLGVLRVDALERELVEEGREAGGGVAAAPAAAPVLQEEEQHSEGVAGQDDQVGRDEVYHQRVVRLISSF